MSLPDPPKQSLDQIIAAIPTSIFADTLPLTLFKIANNTATLVDADYKGSEGELVFSIINEEGFISIKKLYPSAYESHAA